MKAIIHKARIELADLDQNRYTDFSITIARHPSETDERMMARLLAYTLNAPVDGDHGPLEFARDMWNPDEPALWQRDYTGRIMQWIEVGQPDERRILRVTSRCDQMLVYALHDSSTMWWEHLRSRINRVNNLRVYHLPELSGNELASFAERTMDLQFSIQEGEIWVTAGSRSSQIVVQSLYPS